LRSPPPTPGVPLRGRKKSFSLELTVAQRTELQHWQRSTTVPAGRARRARVLLLLDAGLSVKAAAQTTGLPPNNARNWGCRFLAHGLAGLHDQPGRGRQPVFSPRGRAAPGQGGLRTAGPGGPLAGQVGLRGERQRQAEVVAASCRTFEEMLDAVLPVGAGWEFRAGPRQVLVQGHCHQRALVGTGPLLRLLRRLPGAEVVDLDAGCCGLAGSFGYEKEHYDVSCQVGEQRLFPALRRAPADVVVVAPGFSCRTQIAHGSGRTAVHPAPLLYSALRG